MRIIVLLFLLFSWHVSFGSVHQIDSLIVTDSSIIINQETVLSYPFTMDDMERIFGEARKSKTKSDQEQNDIYFWDRIGVMVYCPKNTRNVTSFDVCFRRSYWYETRSMFKGVLIINHQEVNRHTSRSELNEMGFEGQILPNDFFDESLDLDLQKISVIVELKAKNKKIIGFGIFQNKG